MNLRSSILFKAVFFFPLLIACSFSKGQSPDANRIRISLITCGPGDDLYSTWGHTAIRVTDSAAGMDLVFNYGTFDNSDPYFYVKFTRGIMRYALSVESFRDFLQEYKHDHRWVMEQKLLLNGEERGRLFDLLKINSTEENRYYDYQFYGDNCTTRAKNIINNSTHDSIVFNNILAGKTPTYRELFHENLDSCHQYWSEFGIDLLLGSNLDKKVTNEEAMFLPDYLMKGFDTATLHQHALAGKKTVILEGRGATAGMVFLTPLTLFSLLALVFVWLSFSNRSKARNAMRIADPVFFFILGLLGILIVFVWVARVDTVCRDNLNILWVWPTHAFVAFLSRKKHRWINGYFRIAGIVALLTLLAWHWLPQQLNVAFVPLLIIIVLRSLLNLFN